jgi:hypothetical protein
LGDHVADLLGRERHQDGEHRAPVLLGERHRDQRAGAGLGLVDLGHHDPLVGDDLEVLTVEGHLEAGVGDHRIAPVPADSQIDLGDGHLPASAAPPAFDELGGGPSPEDEVPGGVELPSDEDLLVGGEGQCRLPTTRRVHLLPPVV